MSTSAHPRRRTAADAATDLRSESTVAGCCLLALYEAIAAASRRLLFAAQQRDADLLIQSRRLVDELVGVAQNSGLSPDMLDAAGRRKRMEILRRVISDDAEVRDILAPAIARIDAMLGLRPPVRADHPPPAVPSDG